MAELTTDVRYIKGIGEQRAKALNKLGIANLRDLISWFPRTYDDRRQAKRIADLIPGEAACVSAMIASAPKVSHIRKGMDLVKVRAVDETGVLDITFFNQTWLKNSLVQGETYIFYGKAEGNLLLSQVKACHQHTESLSFFVRIEVFSLKVFYKSELSCVKLVCFHNNCGNFCKTCKL